MRIDTNTHSVLCFYPEHLRGVKYETDVEIHCGIPVCGHRDITKLVKSWYGGSPNNGIVLKAANESAAARNVYYASNYPDGSVAYPVLSIYYVNNAGLEDYWSCHSQSAGRAGTGSVNDYTGNLTRSVPIMETTGEKAPMDFSITYNGYRSGVHFEDGKRGLIYGWGW